MKIAILLGRGVEGCGVTRCAIEFQKATPGTKIFATIDKKWARRDSMSFEKAEFKCADWEQSSKVVDEINQNFDCVLIYSVPSKSTPEETQANFVRIIQEIKLPKGIVQLDHKMQSMSRNGRFDECCENVDVLMTHSLKSDFVRWLAKRDIVTPMKKMALGFNYDEHRAKYWKPIEEQDDRTIRWIGRTSGWKGPNLMMNFHIEQMRSRNFITVLEGLEAQIGWWTLLYKDKERTMPFYKDGDLVNKFRPRKELGEVGFAKDGSEYGTEVHGSGVYLYPPYKNAECMERLSRSAFGSDLYHLKAHMYGNNIENCHAECIASGTVPIFHKHFCDNVIHRVTGNPVSLDSNSGTIGLDETNFEETATLIEKLASDPVMRDDWREMSFEYWKSHSDASVTAAEIVDNLMGEEDEVAA